LPGAPRPGQVDRSRLQRHAGRGRPDRAPLVGGRLVALSPLTEARGRR
jgi:hypothetical protein